MLWHTLACPHCFASDYLAGAVGLTDSLDHEMSAKQNRRGMPDGMWLVQCRAGQTGLEDPVDLSVSLPERCQRICQAAMSLRLLAMTVCLPAEICDDDKFRQRILINILWGLKSLREVLHHNRHILLEVLLRRWHAYIGLGHLSARRAQRQEVRKRRQVSILVLLVAYIFAQCWV